MKYEEIKNVIKNGLQKFKIKNFSEGILASYTLYIFKESPRRGKYDCFLYIEDPNREKLKDLLSEKFKRLKVGYTPRLAFVLTKDSLLLIDYRPPEGIKKLRKNIRRINRTFLNKLEKALSEPKEENFSKLFDRTDVIEDFYILYKRAREYLLKNIKGIPEEEKREEFVDNFMMQMLTLWYLQERGFFNNDKNYFITKFKELKQKKLFNGFKNYYEFLTYFFEKVSDNLDSQYYEDKIVGKVVVIGPAVFLNGEHIKAISISDKCFYKEGMTDVLINT